MAEELFDQLWEVLQAMGRDLQEAGTGLGLTPMQAMLIDRLDDQEPMPQTWLAQRLHCDTSNLTGIVDALEAKGLVARTTPPGDRRIRAVVATEAGQATRARLRSRLRDQHPLLSRLDAEEQSRLSTLLARILDD